LRMGCQQLINLLGVLLHAADENRGVLRHRRIGGSGPLGQQFEHWLATELSLKQDVKRPLAGFGASCHDCGFGGN